MRERSKSAGEFNGERFSETTEAVQNFHQQGREASSVSLRLLKRVVNEAAGEKTPEAYPLGYVEDFSS